MFDYYITNAKYIVLNHRLHSNSNCTLGAKNQITVLQNIDFPFLSHLQLNRFSGLFHHFYKWKIQSQIKYKSKQTPLPRSLLSRIS